ncbi:MAG: hypothetical protein GY854_19720 [Deltaproteobacteria bacterium]|nr:hypothetical protein [Deltaproteobacteria bacterium]
MSDHEFEIGERVRVLYGRYQSECGTIDRTIGRYGCVLLDNRESCVMPNTLLELIEPDPKAPGQPVTAETVELRIDDESGETVIQTVIQLDSAAFTEAFGAAIKATEDKPFPYPADKPIPYSATEAATEIIRDTVRAGSEIAHAVKSDREIFCGGRGFGKTATWIVNDESSDAAKLVEFINGSIIHTYSAVFELKNGDRVVIPEPGEGWECVNRVDGAQSINLSDRFELQVTHMPGKLIAHEYGERMRQEEAQCLSWKKWRQLPAEIEQYTGGFPLLRKHLS